MHIKAICAECAITKIAILLNLFLMANALIAMNIGHIEPIKIYKIVLEMHTINDKDLFLIF